MTDFTTYFKPIWRALSKDEKMQLADNLFSSYAYLSQLANGHRKPGKHFKRALEREVEALGT